MDAKVTFQNKKKLGRLHRALRRQKLRFPRESLPEVKITSNNKGQVHISMEPAVSLTITKIPSKPFPFLRLPPELRLMVYGYFKPAGIHLDSRAHNSIEKNKSYNLMLLETSRLIYAEAMPVIYSAPVWFGGGLSDVIPSLRNLSPMARPLIKNLTLSIPFFEQLEKTITYLLAELDIRVLKLEMDYHLWRESKITKQLERFRNLDELALGLRGAPQKELALLRAQVLRTTDTARSSPFLSLPASIRFRIYNHLLVSKVGSLRVIPADQSRTVDSTSYARLVLYKSSRFNLAIFRTNKQVYEESTVVFLSENDFVPFNDSCTTAAITYMLHLKQIRREPRLKLFRQQRLVASRICSF